jgi:4-hydroxybenzoate polyprenyltransferase
MRKGRVDWPLFASSMAVIAVVAGILAWVSELGLLAWVGIVVAGLLLNVLLILVEDRRRDDQ